MPAHSKNLTERATLRYTTTERAIIANVVRAHAEVGITISVNDAIRILIRRAATPLPDSLDLARDRWAAHVADCMACQTDRPGCPDGWWLADMWGALIAAQAPAPKQTRRRAILPPPPGK